MDNRFAMLMSLVSCRTLSDIGCDHALIDIALVENNICDRIIASDLRIGPLAAAKKNIAQHHLEDKIETRLSDGLQKFAPGETESILISGMGGRLITRILERSFDIAASAKELILSPQSEIPEFEVWLISHGFEISKKVICKEADKFYFGYLVHYAGEKFNTFHTDNTDTDTTDADTTDADNTDADTTDTDNTDADNTDTEALAAQPEKLACHAYDSKLPGVDTEVKFKSAGNIADSNIHPAAPYTSCFMLPATPMGLYLQYLTREESRYRGALKAYSESYEKVKAKYRNETSSETSAEIPDDLSPDIILQNKIKEIQYEINRLK